MLTLEMPDLETVMKHTFAVKKRVGVIWANRVFTCLQEQSSSIFRVQLIYSVRNRCELEILPCMQYFIQKI